MAALHVTLRQLQIFQAVAESGSTGAAASSIALSQSATSAAINELERMLGLQLFDRVGKRLVLNDNGRALLPRALQVLDGAGGIERWAQAGAYQIGSLRIGASTTIGNYLLPEILAQFRKGLPKAAQTHWEVQVTIANTAAIVEQVSAFRLDLGLIEGPCHAAELTVEPWLEDEMLVVAAPSDPVIKRDGKGRPRISLEALRQASWLLREPGSGTRETVDQLLTPHLHHLRTGIEFGNSEAIKRAAANGLGLACVSRYVGQDFLESGTLLAPATELPQLKRRFYLVSHRDKRPTRGVDLLVNHLRAMAKGGRRRTSGFVPSKRRGG